MADLSNRPVGIRQIMAAGNDFAGTAPEDVGGLITPTYADDLYKYTAATVGGGLFDASTLIFDHEKGGAKDLVAIQCNFGSSVAFTITLVDVDGKETLLFADTAQHFVLTEETKIVILYGSKIKLVTTGGAAEMTATFIYEDHREPGQA